MTEEIGKMVVVLNHDDANSVMAALVMGAAIAATFYDPEVSVNARVVESWACTGGWKEYSGINAPDSEPVQQVWEAFQVPQCGYCQPGMIMASVALLREKPQPTDADIDAAITNICRCGTYNRVRQAIHAAAKK